jgi:hypothetical protein
MDRTRFREQFRYKTRERNKFYDKAQCKTDVLLIGKWYSINSCIVTCQYNYNNTFIFRKAQCKVQPTPRCRVFLWEANTCETNQEIPSFMEP